MSRWFLVFGLLASLAFASKSLAQPNVEGLTKAPYKYQIGPNAGTYVITLKGFKGQDARALAEEFADYIRNTYGLPAYLLDFGSDMREQEEKRIAELRKQHAELVKQNGAENVGPLRYKTHVMEPQFGIFIGGPKGGWKDEDAAVKALIEIKKRPLPPEKFCDRVYAQKPKDKEVTKAETNSSPSSPFAFAFPVRNPTLPKVKVDDDKPDPFLKDLNAGEEYSALKTSKPYTLVVKIYAGATVIKERGTETSILEKLLGNKTGELLNASAMQAHELAKYLRKMKPSYDSYVLHTRQCSYVCVGNFASYDDPQIMEVQKTLANLRIGNVEQLNPKIDIMKIPRP